MPIFREDLGKAEIFAAQQKSNVLFNSTFLGAGTVTTLDTLAARVAVDNIIGGAGSIPSELRLSGTTWTILDKFIHNNTDNGGTAGILGADIKSLLSAMNDSARRSGSEFAILRLTYTGGAGWPALFSVHSYKSYTSVGSMCYWMRVVTKPTAINFINLSDAEMLDERTGTRFDDGEWHYRYKKYSVWAVIDNYGIGVPYTIDIAIPWLMFGAYVADKHEKPHINPVFHLLEDYYK